MRKTIISWWEIQLLVDEKYNVDAIAHPKDTEQVKHHVEAVDRRPGEEEDDADSN